MNPKISVIIPTYKRSEFLKRALNSILIQTYKNLEIIIIDDNVNFILEREKSREIIKNLETENLNIIYIENQENLGGALSRNKGIDRATGEFVAFLDDDDQYLSDKLEKQIKFYKEKIKKNEKGLVYCYSKIVDENNNELYALKKSINGNQRAIVEILKTGFTSTGCILLPKELLVEVNGFEKLICGQEWYLILKILSKGYNCYCQEEELLIYYEHSQERISNNLKKVEGEEQLYKIKKEYIKKLSVEQQKELHYFNNIELARLNFQYKNKDKGFKYLKEAKKYKVLKLQDLLKLFINYYFNEKIKIKIKRVLKYIIPNRSVNQ